MADFGPQVVKFDNERERPWADQAYLLYFGAKSLLLDYATDGIAALIDKVGEKETVDDDSAVQDGRTVVTGEELKDVLTAAQTVVDSFDAPIVGKLSLIEVITKLKVVKIT